MDLSRSLESAVAPLDGAREALLRLLVRSEALKWILRSRDRRIAVQVSIGILVTFSLAATLPSLLIAATPALFGVAHVASDARYLAIRQRLPRGLVRALIAGCSLQVGIRACEMWGPPDLPYARVELALASFFVAAALASGLHRARSLAGLVWGGPIVLLACVGIAYPTAARVAFAHGHNLVAIALWLVLFRRSVRAVWIPLALVPLALLAILGGATLPAAARFGGDHVLGLDLAAFASGLAPGLSPENALAVAVSFAFLQSIHYSLWLGAIPQETLLCEGTLSFRMTVRGLVRDFGAWGLAAVAALAFAVLVASTIRLEATRNLYLFIAGGHAYFELAMLAYLAPLRAQ